MMREIIKHHDNTEFKDENRVFALPEVPPTGKGYMHDDRETSHFVRETLHKISPILSAAYLDGHGINNDYDRHLENSDFLYGARGYSRDRDHRAREHALYGHAPSADQSGPRSKLIMVGSGYGQRKPRFF